MPDQELLKCVHCGREVFANGEASFACPYCGATVEAARRTDESAEERLERLEREVARANVRTDIEKEATNDMFWRNPLGLFAGLDRQQARQALERGDVEAAKRHLESAKRTSGVGCVVNVIIIAIIILVVLAVIK